MTGCARVASRRASEPCARPLAPMSFGLCGSHGVRGSDTSKGNCADRWSDQSGTGALRRFFQAEIVGLLIRQHREDPRFYLRAGLAFAGVLVRRCMLQRLTGGTRPREAPTKQWLVGVDGGLALPGDCGGEKVLGTGSRRQSRDSGTTRGGDPVKGRHPGSWKLCLRHGGHGGSGLG